MAPGPRVALVLGGGGIMGGAWMVGALRAIAAETGWDPAAADYVIGTSAGAMIGALVASGVAAERLATLARGTVPETAGGGEADERSFGSELRLHWSFPRPVLGSPGLALRSLREPWRYGPAGIIAWLPHGVISTEPLKAAVRAVVPAGWSPHPNLWIVAIDYESGERVVFGRDGAPQAELADAVAASCAIPGFYHPVAIGGRHYVDGGVYSPANLDVAASGDAGVVLCLNPLTSRHHGHWLEPSGPLARLVRGGDRSRLEREARSLRGSGRRVLLVEPQAEDLQAMGFNYMSGRRRVQVLETAFRTTAAVLRGSLLGRILADLAASRASPAQRGPGGRAAAGHSTL